MNRASNFFPPKSVCVACVMTAIIEIAVASATAGQPLPPQAKFRGKTVADWSLLQNEWAIATDLGQQTGLSDTVKGMRFLPQGFGPGDFEFDVTVPPGTGIVSSPFFAFGELYADMTSDDPDALAEVLNLIFSERTIEVRLDGDIVQSGTPEELSAYTYGPTFFDEPVFYDEPQDRGEGSPPAIAAIWTIGLGGVYHPLTPGEHTLVVESDGPVFGANSFSYNIFVDTLGVSTVPEPTAAVLGLMSLLGLVALRRECC